MDKPNPGSGPFIINIESDNSPIPDSFSTFFFNIKSFSLYTKGCDIVCCPAPSLTATSGEYEIEIELNQTPTCYCWLIPFTQRRQKVTLQLDGKPLLRIRHKPSTFCGLQIERCAPKTVEISIPQRKDPIGLLEYPKHIERHGKIVDYLGSNAFSTFTEKIGCLSRIGRNMLILNQRGLQIAEFKVSEYFRSHRGAKGAIGYDLKFTSNQLTATEKALILATFITWTNNHREKDWRSGICLIIIILMIIGGIVTGIIVGQSQKESNSQG